MDADEPVWVREDAGPRWTGRVSPRYGLLCYAPNEWYVKDRLRAHLRQTGRLDGWPREKALGGSAGLALEGRMFASRDAAVLARNTLQALENSFDAPECASES